MSPQADHKAAVLAAVGDYLRKHREYGGPVDNLRGRTPPKQAQDGLGRPRMEAQAGKVTQASQTGQAAPLPLRLVGACPASDDRPP